MKKPSESKCEGRKSLILAGKMRNNNNKKIVNNSNKNRKENENGKYSDLIT